MQVIIMRGIPGSGKSTWVNSFLSMVGAQRCHVVSADNFHIDEHGTYKFDPLKAGIAHRMCLSQFLSWMEGETIDRPEFLIVDNTNTTAWEIAPYYQVADSCGHQVKIVQIDCPFHFAMLRGIHNVPPSKVWAMHQNLMSERLPPHWIVDFA